MAAQEEEQSMEEILQSIKKIIAEDDEEGVEAVEAAEDPETLEIADIEDLPEETPAKEAEAPSQDDVDAMFDEIEVEPSVEEIPPAEVKTEGLSPEPEAASLDAGLEEIAEALEEDDDILELTEEIEDEGLEGFDEIEEIIEAPENESSEPIAANEAVVTDEAEGLLSSEAATKAASALAQLKQPSAAAGEKLAFRSGTTVEDLVLEALRPMLKEWLNNELPSTVERMVADEIKRISQ